MKRVKVKAHTRSVKGKGRSKVKGHFKEKKTGTYKGKSNKLGYGGRSAQLLAHGVPKAVIGEIARTKGAAPGESNFHGKRK